VSSPVFVNTNNPVPAKTRRYDDDEIGNRNSSEVSEAGESDYIADEFPSE